MVGLITATPSYSPQSATGGGIGTATEDANEQGYWSLEKCKRAYQDYLWSKRAEIDEQKQARRYRHAAHWTDAQIKILNARKQPVVTYNRIGRKINDIVGIVERLRKDPKGYPRTPQHEQGAELVSMVLREALDEARFKQIKSPTTAERAATEGIGGVEFELIPGDQGDPTIAINEVDGESFFYGRSFKYDFSDAPYMGIGKWLDLDMAIDLIPDKEQELRDSVGDSSDLTSNTDRDIHWFDTSGNRKQVRLIDIWYRHKGEFCWSLFTGSAIIKEGRSPWTDEKGKTASKFIMFSAGVDHDGDRYGFPRDLKSANDEINQRRSKGLHELNARRIIAEQGAFEDPEKARTEAARPDGFIITQKGFAVQFDDQAKMANVQGQLQFLQDAKDEIENYGGNPALIETNANAKSGRAIALLQQAGLAQLGPFILWYSDWKIRVYRQMWCAIKQHWTSERWIRVTDDQSLAQFVKVNEMQVGPGGMPQIVNQLGALDVDIILDEGPDQINMAADTFDALNSLLPSIAPMLTPPLAMVVLEGLFSLSPLPGSIKKKFKDAIAASQQPQQPDPMQQQMQQLQMDDARATIGKKMAEAGKIQADTGKVAADTGKVHIDAQKTMADTAKTQVETADAYTRVGQPEHPAGGYR